MSIETFLTAYDPSDLPGGSVDPLGFDRGYGFLADKILPGLTNVGNRPRYFGVLCAGVSLADMDPSAPLRTLYRERRESVLRLERLWALANVLYASKADKNAGGIRGINYVVEEIGRLDARGARKVRPDYPLLLRQAPYGVLGIYGNVAEGMRLLERKAFTLSPDLGQRLAEAFLKETDIPPSVRRSVEDRSEVDRDELVAWGERAFINGEIAEEEGRCLSEAFLRDPVRSRMAPLLSETPFSEGMDELERLEAISARIPDGAPEVELRDAMRAILAFEDCYRLVLLGFERMLWLCRQLCTVSRDVRRTDGVLASVCSSLPEAIGQLESAIEQRTGEHLGRDLARLGDARDFLKAAAAAGDPLALSDVLLRRHRDVQHGKLDRGRRKMPWIDEVEGGIALTSARVGGLGFEATEPSQISAHPYRLASADALLAASVE
jgi:hypothetical protein